MCICVDCRWVDRCRAYHAVEEQHEAMHLCERPDFKPINPRIVVSIASEQSELVDIEWDVRSCESFDLDSGRWLRLRPGQEVPA